MFDPFDQGNAACDAAAMDEYSAMLAAGYQPGYYLRLYRDGDSWETKYSSYEAAMEAKAKINAGDYEGDSPMTATYIGEW